VSVTQDFGRQPGRGATRATRRCRCGGKLRPGARGKRRRVMEWIDRCEDCGREEISGYLGDRAQQLEILAGILPRRTLRGKQGVPVSGEGQVRDETSGRNPRDDDAWRGNRPDTPRRTEACDPLGAIPKAQRARRCCARSGLARNRRRSAKRRSNRRLRGPIAPNALSPAPGLPRQTGSYFLPGLRITGRGMRRLMARQQPDRDDGEIFGRAFTLGGGLAVVPTFPGPGRWKWRPARSRSGAARLRATCRPAAAGESRQRAASPEALS
jgi:hypothetical protein